MVAPKLGGKVKMKVQPDPIQNRFIVLRTENI